MDTTKTRDAQFAWQAPRPMLHEDTPNWLLATTQRYPSKDPLPSYALEVLAEFSGAKECFQAKDTTGRDTGA